MKIKLFEPTQPQIDALKVIYQDKPAVTVLNYGRQTGKTFLMQMDSINWCINNPKNLVMFVSPVFENNARILNDIMNMFDEHKEVRDLIIEKIKIKEQEIHFLNGSILKFRSAEAGNNLRGAKLHRLYVDEAAFIQEWVFTDVLLPMLIRTGGQAILGSTSNHVEWFRKLKQEGFQEENKDDVITLQRTYLDLNDDAVTKFVEGVLKKRLTKDKFDQEVLNKDVNSEALFHNIEECLYEFSEEELEKLAQKRLYIGIDVATSNDYTVVTLGTEDYEVIAIDRFNMKEDMLDHTEFKERLLALYRKHYPQLDVAYFEVNNNQLLFDELFDMPNGGKLYEWITSTDSKRQIITWLIKLFDEKKLKIINNNQLRMELYGFERKISPVTGRIIYANGSSSMHDDTVMSLAIYAWCVKNESTGGTTEIF